MTYGENDTVKHKDNDNPVQVDNADLKVAHEKHQESLREKTAYIGQVGKVPKYTDNKKDEKEKK